MSENKLSLLLICKEESARTLLTFKLKKYSRFNLIGSCGIDNTVERFLKIYNPDIVILYAFGKIRGEEYKCVLNIKNNYKSKILVIDPNPNDYDAHMFFRCGASSVTYSGEDLEKFILDTSVLVTNFKYPSNKLHNLPVTIKREMYDRTYADKLMEAYSNNSRFYSYDSGLLKNRFNLISTNNLLGNKNKYTIKKFKEELKYRVSNRIFPSNPDDLVDYRSLYPESFMKVSSSKESDDHRERFLVNFNQNLIKKVLKLRKIEEKPTILDKNTLNFNGFSYDFEASKSLGFE